MIHRILSNSPTRSSASGREPELFAAEAQRHACHNVEWVTEKWQVNPDLELLG
jgi:hypothetical protein